VAFPDSPIQQVVQEQLDEAWDHINEGLNKWPNMTYEQGVQAALDWMLGNVDDPPMEE